MSRSKVLLALVMGLLVACTKKENGDGKPTTLEDAFAASDLGKKQAECNANGVILDSSVDATNCDTIPIATWTCTEAGLKERLTPEGLDNFSTSISELEQVVADGFEMAQCGEKEASGITTIKVILLKKEFDGTTFSALPKSLTLEFSAKGTGYIRLNPFKAPINECHPGAIELRSDLSYQLQEADADVEISLNTSLSVYSSSTCSTPVTSLTLKKGESTVLAWFKETAENTDVSFEAEANEFAPVTTVLLDFVNESISPKLSLARFEPTGSTSENNVGACIPIRINQIANSGPKYATMSSDAAIAVSTSSGKLFSDNGCFKEISSTTMAAGSAFQMIWLKATSAGPAIVTASASFDNETLTLAIQ